MDFSIIDFIVGLLMVGAMMHVMASRAGIRFPSVYGYGPKANLIHGLLIAFLSVDIYFFTYGFDAVISNGTLMGALDLILLYALFGRSLHEKIQKRDVSI